MLEINNDVTVNKKLAVVVHAFYIDVFVELMGRFLNGTSSEAIKFYVTTVEANRIDICSCLDSCGFEYELLVVENRGRDVLPFIKILPLVYENQHHLLLKLHTKKSKHLKNGESWRNSLYDGLVFADGVSKKIEMFDQNPKLGVWTSDEHWAPMTMNFELNKDRVFEIGHKLSLPMDYILETPFPAGTMFFARTRALTPLLNLDVKDSDFEPEGGQLDGTLAHAIERAIPLCIMSAGYFPPPYASQCAAKFGLSAESNLSVVERMRASFHQGGWKKLIRDIYLKIKKVMLSHEAKNYEN